jgi:predicted DNA-binding transcriptional regulator YafY
MADIRVARLLQLVTILRARTARNPKELAAELGVSKRTVHRDLKALTNAHIPWHFDREIGGYRLGDDFFLPPVQLTLGEAMALSVMGSQLSGRKQIPFLEDAWRAVTKVRSQLPAVMREQLAQADGQVQIEGTRVSPQTGCEPHFETMRGAIAACRKVRCAYHGGKHDRPPFLFRPYKLFFCQRAWYVIGHSEAADGERSLKLNRLSKVERTDRPYAIPDGWTLERTFGKAWRMMRGDRRYLVKIEFDREVGRNVADTLWHATQRITWSRGVCIFECEVDGLDEIVWWVLGYGHHARVLAPAELVDRVVSSAELVRGKYGPLREKVKGKDSRGAGREKKLVLR